MNVPFSSTHPFFTGEACACCASCSKDLAFPRAESGSMGCVGPYELRLDLVGDLGVCASASRGLHVVFHRTRAGLSGLGFSGSLSVFLSPPGVAGVVLLPVLTVGAGAVTGCGFHAVFQSMNRLVLGLADFFGFCCAKRPNHEDVDFGSSGGLFAAAISSKSFAFARAESGAGVSSSLIRGVVLREAAEPEVGFHRPSREVPLLGVSALGEGVPCSEEREVKVGGIVSLPTGTPSAVTARGCWEEEKHLHHDAIRAGGGRREGGGGGGEGVEGVGGGVRKERTEGTRRREKSEREERGEEKGLLLLEGGAKNFLRERGERAVGMRKGRTIHTVYAG